MGNQLVQRRLELRVIPSRDISLGISPLGCAVVDVVLHGDDARKANVHGALGNEALALPDVIKVHLFEGSVGSSGRLRWSSGLMLRSW